MRTPVTVDLKILMRTHRSLLVAPGGDQERAAWLDLSVIEIGGQKLDGNTSIRLEKSLAKTRGLLR